MWQCCPFQVSISVMQELLCKSLESCYIHVLKLNATFPDKTPSSISPLFVQPSTDKPPAVSSSRIASFRQLSSTFSQFHGVQVSSRGRRPLSWKDAIAVNGWRFSKLKGYTEGNLKAETEAFERYMQNVSLLDEVFSSNLFLDGLMRDGLPAAGDSSYNEEDENIKAILTMKARLKSSAERIDSYRGMIKGMVSQGLNRMKVESCDEGDSLYNDDVDDCVDLKRPKKVDKLGATRTMAVDDLIDKLNKARREDDLKSYLEMKLQLFDSNVHGKASCYLSEAVQLSCRENCVEVTTSREISDIEAVSSCHSLPKLWNSIEVDQACLANIDMQFSSLDEVANL